MEMETNKDNLNPGQRVSVDHFHSSIPGGIYTSRWRTDNKYMHHEGYIFDDHASGYIQVIHQVAVIAADTAEAKLTYERDAYHEGVFIQWYHTYNGVFTSKDLYHKLFPIIRRLVSAELALLARMKCLRGGPKLS